jgi:hypothetical protein
MWAPPTAEVPPARPLVALVEDTLPPAGLPPVVVALL